MKKNNLILAIISFFIFAFIFTLLPNYSAQAGLWDMQKDTLGEIETTFENVGTTDDPEEIVIEVIKIFLGFVGLIVIVILIWGGFRWMNAGGNDEELKKSKQVITRALIGLVIIIASYAITEFIVYLTEDILDGW